MNNPLEIAVYEILDKRAADLRSKGVSEFDIKAGDLKEAIGPPASGQIRQLCDCLENDSLVSRAGLELKERIGPPGFHATVFRYRVHGVSGSLPGQTESKQKA